MARTDLRINQFGIDGSTIKVGQVVLVAWRDAPPEYDVVTEVSGERQSYKGERSIRLLNSKTSAAHTQIMEIHGDLRLPAVKSDKKQFRLS